jgi:hypothetical protein
MEERNMKRVLMGAGIVALFAFVFSMAQAADEAKAQTVQGMVKVDKEAKTITLTVKAAKEGEKETVYTVVDNKDGAVAKLDGKEAKVTGVVTEKEKVKTITAEKAEEVKAAAKE